MDTRQIVDSWYDAIGRGDMNAITAGLSPSIVLELPEDQWNKVIPYLGTHVGLNEVAEAFRIRAETTEVLDYGLRGLFVDGNTACAVVYTKGRHTRTKVLFEIEDMHKLVLNDQGKITHWKVYFDPNTEVNAFNADREQRLYQAAARGDAKETQELLDFGGDPNQHDQESGLTPLMAAAVRGDDTVIRTLLSGGADVLVTERSGQTALHKAAENGNTETVRALVRAGSIVDAPVATTGQTPLHIAVRHGNAEAARVLLESGARPDATDHLGRTPQDLARELLAPEVVGALFA
ncbi:ankyrin repeat domain-containing protein [Kibdelosporangium philippinense]|uniref:Ankyrin repeat domain-containing protein n=1 Tax=Kibdelosporangium philippinense TaxID=211113 RepID=A0ABS8ZHD7_9PSEU|nr:ankyrin repeat domain-containing protein [Kibdelosporangium philippinense]MCE7007190.1 ankyrin repeat domain-containing protein [Kibdelosporangium philippinense]